jgi:hypothetical protein
LKKLLLILFTLTAFGLKAQKVTAIFVNLYTDSLKKGTYNYINIDGQLENGRYIPLDNKQINFECKQAKFDGNNLVLPADFAGEKVSIKVWLKKDAAIVKEFEVYVKKTEDPPLKSATEVLETMKPQPKEKKKKKKR